MNGLTDTKTEKVAEIIRDVYPGPIKNLLVVGCGDGIEAAILSTKLNTRVIGVDLTDSFDPAANEIADLRIGDALALGFSDESFDFVFSYHALEHISDPVKALQEMRRVLKKGGGFWIGTPNRTRLIGYIGAKEGSLSDKIRWNLNDYSTRLAGRFRNEYGAHAGFSPTELRSMLAGVFSSVTDASDTYFDTIYERLRGPLRITRSFGLSRFVYPSVYFTGKK